MGELIGRIVTTRLGGGRVGPLASKFAKSRELALQPSTLDALHGYATRRDRLCTEPETASFAAPTLEAYFTERLIGQRHASANTVAAYRDTWRLLLRFTGDADPRNPNLLLWKGSTSKPHITRGCA